MSPVSPHPSLSRDLQNGSVPLLLHNLHESGGSVLSLAANDVYIFSGSQNEDIMVWDKKTFQLKDTLRGHTGSVLALVYADEKGWLFSSSGDSTVRIWSAKTLSLLFTIDPYQDTGAGDLFSLAWSSTLQTLFIGCQNTSLQWLDFRHSASQSNSGAATPTRKAHKFFDSYPQYQRRPADIFAKNGITAVVESGQEPRLAVPASNSIESEHFGYIYCMALLDDKHNGVKLVTGSGDESVKVWECSHEGPRLKHTFQCYHGAVLSIVVQGETVYAGCQDGHVKVLDLETRTLVRTIIVQEGIDILSLYLIQSDLYTCSANGQVMGYSRSFDCTASWRAHDGIVLSSIITRGKDGNTHLLVTGGNDSHIKVWDIRPPAPRFTESEDRTLPSEDAISYALSKFVSIPSVSSSASNKEDCRQAAIWLKKCLTQLGAQSALLPTGGTNPLVLGTFASQGVQNRTRPRLLFYGHYDVIPAPAEGWTSDPFTLHGRNGYLYGRGVTDNKGPIMAVAFAAAELLYRRALGVDVVFLIEGEEECGSAGFEAAVKKYKDEIGHIDAILLSNSTWISEDAPCITYGLRGVIHCSLEISSAHPDLHSGVDGGGVVEPMLDMINLLSTLTDSKRHVKIPGFYDDVRPQTQEEKDLYAKLSEVTQKPASALSSRWREPSLTVHTMEISGPKNATVIPGTVKAQVSIRIVPDQDLETIAKSFCTFVKDSFHGLDSPNKLEVNVVHTADWWLGNLDDPWSKALESAIEEEWNSEPLRIREGGSIPSIPFLEKAFGCHALHLPMGQSLDQAHLPNERISLNNLQRGKEVIARFLAKVANMYK
ncbi:beta-ala-his dipeptidase [Moniliophthora roreri MCA 2997]|uniref:Beta-ala-his dipeptidase n=1 Tax=Moniliophthora roreri (strain MCA 2997) TaxID=1381753 RepID=V2XZ80_MONRO|nr:beta-ala-his dipeptidase [Moniliophthora roreri MCA 2997]